MILYVLLVVGCLLSSVLFSVKAREAWVAWKTKGHPREALGDLVSYSILAAVCGVLIVAVLLLNAGFHLPFLLTF